MAAAQAPSTAGQAPQRQQNSAFAGQPRAPSPMDVDNQLVTQMAQFAPQLQQMREFGFADDAENLQVKNLKMKSKIKILGPSVDWWRCRTSSPNCYCDERMKRGMGKKHMNMEN